MGADYFEVWAINLVRIPFIPEVPVPVALWLFGSGLIGLVGMAGPEGPVCNKRCGGLNVKRQHNNNSQAAY